MSYLFTSESVSEGHPDKIADQISDALVDHFLAFDPLSKVACETLVTTGQVVLAGEVKSSTYLDAQEIAREVIRKIGYTKSEYMFEANSCGIFSAIHEQSADINQGVEKADLENQGAGDQGIMFGYATDETSNYMPLALEISHLLDEALVLVQLRQPPAKGATERAAGAAISMQEVAQLPLVIPSRPNAIRMHVESEMALLGCKPMVALEIDGISGSCGAGELLCTLPPGSVAGKLAVSI